MSETRTSAVGEARFSLDETHRYLLTRPDIGNEPGARGTCLFIMLNPSTADESKNDPTVSRCIDVARRWGFARLEACNIFSIRGTDPRVIRTPGATGDPVNLETILWRANAALQGDSIVICAWGVHGAFERRGRIVRDHLVRRGVTPMCLGLTKGGHPRHPLYLSSFVKPQVYE